MSRWEPWRTTAAGWEFTGWSAGGTPTTTGAAPLLWFHDELDCRPCPMLDLLAELRPGPALAVTIPAFGDARRPDWVESVRDLADALLDLTDALDAPRITLGGASFGGWLAAELALRIVDRVDALVLVAPAGLRRNGETIADHWFLTDDEQDALLFHDVAKRPRPALDDDLANNEALARYTWSRRFHDPTLAARVHRLTMPVLLLWGEQDQLIPVRHASCWTDALPAARLVEVLECGHYPGYEQPDRAALATGEFLGAAGNVVGAVS